LDDNFKRKMVAYCGLIGAKDGLTPCEKKTPLKNRDIRNISVGGSHIKILVGGAPFAIGSSNLSVATIFSY
jgi:hypothetical protein